MMSVGLCGPHNPSTHTFALKSPLRVALAGALAIRCNLDANRGHFPNQAIPPPPHCWNDAKASKGAKKAYECVMNQKSVQDIWGELGLQEMPDSYDTDSNCSGGSHISEESNEDSPENWPKQPRLT